MTFHFHNKSVKSVLHRKTMQMEIRQSLTVLGQRGESLYGFAWRLSLQIHEMQLLTFCLQDGLSHHSGPPATLNVKARLR